MTYKSTVLSLIGAPLLLSAAIAQANNLVLEEVLVTAQKRAQSLQDVALSVSAVSGEKMANAGITDLADISAYVPNFQKADTPAGSMLSIRGISSGINMGFEQSVVTYTDDIAMGRAPLARMPFMDLERVEVLRGPQNVLFGKNSIAGALSMTTAKPTDEFYSRVSASYAPDFDEKQTDLVVSGPLTDSLRGRVAMRYSDEAGFMENTSNGDDEAGLEQQSIRATLAWDASDTVEATLKVETGSFDYSGRSDEMTKSFTNTDATSPFNGMTFLEVADLVGQGSGQDIGSDDGTQNYKRGSNHEEFSNTDVDMVTLTVNWDLGWATMTSVTGYAAYELDEAVDLDSTGIDVLHSVFNEQYDQLSQEIRFTSPGGETVDWIAGIYYQQWDLDYNSHFLIDDENFFTALGDQAIALGLPANTALLGQLANNDTVRDFDSESKTYAAFGQLVWNIADDLRLNVGGRYTEETKSAHREMNSYDTTTGEFNFLQALVGNVVFGVDYNNLGEASGGAIHDLTDTRKEKSFTPTVVAEWNLNGDHMMYASASKGFKAGGFDARGNQAGNFEYENESVTAYELGLKSSLLDGSAEMNVAIFHSEYQDLQVSQFDGTLGFIVGNAAAATSRGVEMDGRWFAAEGLVLSASMGYLDFTFDDFSSASCSASEIASGSGQICDRSGDRNIFSPEWASSISADYVINVADGLDYRITADVNYRDEQITGGSLDPASLQDSVVKTNLRMALEADQWTVALLVRNLTDEDVTSFTTGVPLSGGDLVGAPAYTGYMERPRTFTLQASYVFD